MGQEGGNSTLISQNSEICLIATIGLIIRKENKLRYWNIKVNIKMSQIYCLLFKFIDSTPQ